jgi:hypothetical protein
MTLLAPTADREPAPVDLVHRVELACHPFVVPAFDYLAPRTEPFIEEVGEAGAHTRDAVADTHGVR